MSQFLQVVKPEVTSDLIRPFALAVQRALRKSTESIDIIIDYGSDDLMLKFDKPKWIMVIRINAKTTKATIKWMAHKVEGEEETFSSTSTAGRIKAMVRHRLVEKHQFDREILGI